MYKDVDKPELVRGIKLWRNPGNQFNIFMLHYTADLLKDPERQGKEWFEAEKKGTIKAVWLKEYEIDFTTKSGKLIYGPDFCDFSPKVHLINSFELPEPIELLISLDFGQRHPTVGLIGAWTMDNRLYIIDEYYKPAIPSVSSREMFDKFGYLMPGLNIGASIREKQMAAINNFQVRVIDPSTKAKNRTKVSAGEEIPYSIIEEFSDNGWDFELGNNDVDAGITRVREYLQIGSDGLSHLYIFKDRCPHLAWEMQHYRYQELSDQQKKNSNESEKPVKKDDDAVDALRYMINTRPNAPHKQSIPKTRIQKDIENLTKPQIMGNDWDID